MSSLRKLNKLLKINNSIEISCYPDMYCNFFQYDIVKYCAKYIKRCTMKIIKISLIISILFIFSIIPSWFIYTRFCLDKYQMNDNTL